MIAGIPVPGSASTSSRHAADGLVLDGLGVPDVLALHFDADRLSAPMSGSQLRIFRRRI